MCMKYTKKLRHLNVNFVTRCSAENGYFKCMFRHTMENQIWKIVNFEHEQYECHFYYKKYRTYLSFFRLHIRTEHEEEQNYACDKCDLKKHKEKHENVKNYFCNFCTERYLNQNFD